MNHENLHLTYKRSEIRGRYLNLEKIESILKSWNTKSRLQILGKSVQNRALYKFEIGTGKTRILMWSQMHGNESTTTKALLDFMNLLQDESEIAKDILNQFTFCIIPMLNPDGAERYTRVNANDIDLNRDFQNLSQPESRLLFECYKNFKPDYCYNLHDQRTIFGVGTTGKAATVSFLAPSYDETNQYDEARLQSVAVIMKMVKVLKKHIPGQIGRFDDAFNSNCVGDTFQSLKTPTILIEAGHFKEDYEREITRKFVFIALLSAFESTKEIVVVDAFIENYLNIPQNNPNFFDILYKNVRIKYDNSDFITNFAIQYKEDLKEGKIFFNAFITKIGNLDDFFSHYWFDAQQKKYTDFRANIPKLDAKADFYLDNNVKVVNGLVKK